MAATERVRVVIIEDHELVAESVGIALRLRGFDAIRAPLGSAADALAAVEEAETDLVLLDLDLGEPIGDGADLVPGLVATGARVVVLTASSQRHRVGRAVELGAVGALRKNVPVEQLVTTVVAAARGEAVMDLQERRAWVAEARERRRATASALSPFTRLTTREAEVLRALADGLSVGRIADAWSVTEATVRSQVRGVLTKLDVGSQLEAVALARRTGWLDL